MIKVAALYVLEDGPYSNLPGVDVWGITKDARTYNGPHPVVAHPPCERWGRYWSGGPSAKVRREMGDDQGCFRAALTSVQKWGGVLEHPEASHAWKHFGLERPSWHGGWTRADQYGWTCCVAQGHYGHVAQKMTWLYVVGAALPELTWGTKPGMMRLDSEFHSKEERRRATRTGVCQRLSKRQRASTPVKFRDLLISIARNEEMKA